MPRQSRIVIPNTPHHITQRGNYGQEVFDNADNYKQYCEWMNKYALEKGLEVLAYCLMGNHVHFIVIPPKEDSLSKVFNTVHMRYAHYLNRQRGLRGHLWQARFYSCILDDEHLYRAIRYVENNPVRSKIAKEACFYEYSSAKDHLGIRKKAHISLNKWYQGIGKQEWSSYLKEEDQEMAVEIRLKTSRGLVVGTERFIKKLEIKLNRSLECLQQGRQRKKG